MIVIRRSMAFSFLLVTTISTLHAQETNQANRPNSSAVIEEIIVTAQKRAFSAQLTPVALTAATGENLRENGIVSALDLNGISPSLTVATSNGQLQLTMRGVGNEILLSGVGEAGVAPHSNGIYLGSNVTATATFFDIERVEIMRGPQGTLWGRNSTGGAINVIQKKPTEEFEAFAALDYGRYNSLDLEGAISGSLTDGIQARLALKRRTSDGYLENLAPGGDDLGDDDTFSSRVSVNFDLGARGTWLLAAGYSEWDLAGRSVKQEGTAFPEGSNNPFGFRGDLAFAEISYGEFARRGEFETYSTNQSAGEETDLHYLTSELSLDFENTTLTLLTDYREHSREYRLDGDFTGSEVESVFLNFDEEAEEFSQEVRLSSIGESDLDWVLGLYYYQQDLDLQTTVEWGPYPGIPDLIFGGAFGPEYPLVAVDFGGSLEVQSLGFFGQSTYRFSDGWAATLGLRYSRDDKETDEYSDFYIFGLGGSPVQQGVGEFDDDWSDWTGKVGLEYTASENVFIFVNAAKGYKSGGINVGALTGAFDPEELINYEIGIKSTLLDGRLRANATAYFSDFTDYQLQSVLGLNTIITNGDAEISGLELEVDFKPSTTWLLSMVATFTDSEITSFSESGLLNPANNQPITAGEPTPRTPDSSYRVSVEKRFELKNATDVVARVSYTWQDDVNLDPFGTFGAQEDSYGTTDALLSWSADDGSWSANLYGKNLTNEFYKTGTYFYSLLLGSTIQAQVAPPRTYGVRFSRNF